MLAIEVAFLTGRYVATAYNTRTEAEWPPHPARFFSALVATHFAAEFPADALRAAERDALEWLERQGPPHIHASGAAHRDVVTVFVPVNDVALTDVDEDGRRLSEARARLHSVAAAGDGKAVKKALVAVSKAESAFMNAVARSTGVPQSAANPQHGRRVLPEHRNRQPRTFPSVTPEHPCVTFVWPEANPSPNLRAGLAGILPRVVRLGHSSSLVSVRVVDTPPIPVWRPSGDGELSLRVVDGGQLRALEDAFLRHAEEEPRIMPARAQAYTRRVPSAVSTTPVSVFSEQWLVLRRVEGPQLPVASAVGLSRAVRKALMSFASDPIPEMLSGHAPDGRPSAVPHLAVVPLPFVGHAHATGAILGVALVLPRSAGDGDKRAVYHAVSRWESTFRQEDEDTPRIKLNLGAAGELWLERVEWGVVQASLRSEAWCRPATVWASVTPVALDRNPGDLRSRDDGKLAVALSEAEVSVRRACLRIGLPEPTRVDVLPAAPWAGATKARLYPPYPGVQGRAQRVLMHARLEFEQPVGGPVMLGAGRFVGLGVFRPESH